MTTGGIDEETHGTRGETKLVGNSDSLAESAFILLYS